MATMVSIRAARRTRGCSSTSLKLSSDRPFDQPSRDPGSEERRRSNSANHMPPCLNCLPGSCTSASRAVADRMSCVELSAGYESPIIAENLSTGGSINMSGELAKVATRSRKPVQLDGFASPRFKFLDGECDPVEVTMF